MTSLSASTNYIVEVWAVGPGGSGTITNTRFTTQAAPVVPAPSAVRNLGSSRVDEDSAFIDWDAPSNANVAGPITYRARVNNGAIID